MRKANSKKRRKHQSRSRRSDDTLLALKNVVRGNAATYESLNLARSIAAEDSIREFARWSAKSWSIAGSLSHLRSRRVNQLLAHPTFSSRDLDAEVSWAIGTLEVFSAQMRMYVKRKEELEEAVLDGNFDEAARLIDEIEGRCGFSLWSLATRIGLTQLSKGIEAQKELVQSIKEQGAQHQVNFLSFYWSVRAEDDTSPDRFFSDIEKKIAIWKLDRSAATFIRYQLMQTSPVDGDEKYVLAEASRTSIIDIYEALVSTMTASFCEGRESFKSLRRVAVQLNFGDSRLEKISRVLDLDFTSLQKVEIVSRESYLEGRKPVLSKLASLEEAKAVAFGDFFYPGKEKGLLARIVGSLKGLQFPGQRQMRAQVELSKFRLLFPNTQFGSWIWATVTSHKGLAFVPRADLELAKFLATKYMEPEVLAWLPDGQDAYRAALNVTYPNALVVTASEVQARYLSTSDEIVRRKLNKNTISQIEIKHAFGEGDTNRLAETSEAMLAAEGLTQIAVQARLASYIYMDDLLGAIKRSVALYLNNPEITTWLPLRQLASELRRLSDQEFKSSPETSIFLDLLAKNIEASKFASLRAYACEDFVNSLGLLRPSEITGDKFPGSREMLTYFLREICTIANLRLSIVYGTEAEVENERISVCSLLVQLDEKNAEHYQDEARELIQGRVVRDALKELQRSKLSIDTEEIRALARAQLKEDYDRYKALVDAGVIVVDEKYQENLRLSLEKGVMSKELYDVPLNEASSLLVKIVSTIFNECALNAEHGLDCYLSLRIRHGALSGLLRGPLNNERLISRKDAPTGSYQRNTHWFGLMQGSVDYDTLVAIDGRLREFSSRYDQIIDDLNSRSVQVRRHEKPDGLFVMDVPQVTVFGLASEIKKETSFDDFLESSLESFWVLAEVSLNRVRSFIESDIRSKIAFEFDALEMDVLSFGAPAILGDAIRRAKHETSLALDRLKEWFGLPEPANVLKFTIQELAEVGLATIRSFYPDFTPKLTVTSDDDVALMGVLRLFSDIFFILFENVQRHSGLSSPNIHVHSSLSHDKIEITIQSDVADPMLHMKSIERSKDRIQSGDYKNVVRGEGGTGFPKLAKLILGGTNKSNLSFNLDEDAKSLSVVFDLPYLELQKNAEASR